MKPDYTALHLIEQFNAQFNQKASMANEITYGDDLIGVAVYTFYEQVDSLHDDGLGTLRYRQVGKYEMGDYFEDIGFTLYSDVQDIGKVHYPIAKQLVSSSSAETLHRTRRYPFKQPTSSILMPRWWTIKWEDITDNYPSKAQEIEGLLLSEIQRLGQIAAARDYKRGWSLYRYLEKVDSFRQTVNNQILADTPYYYCPVVFYEQFSHRYVKMNKAEERKNYLDFMFRDF